MWFNLFLQKWVRGSTKFRFAIHIFNKRSNELKQNGNAYFFYQYKHRSVHPSVPTIFF